MADASTVEVCRFPGCGLPWWLHGSPTRDSRIRTDTHSSHWFDDNREEHERLAALSPSGVGGTDG